MKPISLAYCLKHCLHMFSPYFLMIPCWLLQTRLVKEKVYLRSNESLKADGEFSCWEFILFLLVVEINRKAIGIDFALWGTLRYSNKLLELL
ncbi:hypothetical protein EB796_019982 [Bugula neritina]|uniref:Uncharacterized protein n=1 Tax=Bugula neritina TaxID=10212 RepID=A0A7J7J704_BUGNE|nr:hypothetical protein EB796_019982 [Bugula neritina]